MIYRVIIKFGYREAHFDFDSADQACNFMRIAVEHSAGDEDGNKVTFLMKIVDPNEKESEDD